MLTDSNKLFWTRVTFAILAGMISGIMNFSNDTGYAGVAVIIGMYIISYYVGKNFIFTGKDVSRSTLITTGIGTYIMLSLFTWIFYYTLYVSYFT